jgi:putative DNA primase/helicase
MIEESLLQKFNEDNPPAKKPKSSKGSARKTQKGISSSPEAVKEYLEKFDAHVKEIKPGSGGEQLLILAGCPMNPDHGYGSDTSVVWRETGIGFECKHNGCAGYGWKDVRAKIDSEYSAKSTTANSIDEDDVRIGEKDPATGKLILDPSDPLPSARVFLRERFRIGDWPTLRYYAGEPYRWKGNRYESIEEAELRASLYQFSEHTVRPKWTRDGDLQLVPFQPNSAKVGNLVDAIKAETHLSSALVPPCWLHDDPELPEPADLLPCLGGTLHIPTRRWIPPSPKLFTTFSLTFDFDPNAGPPLRWLDFLNKLWPNDPQSIETLQEWFGYCLTGWTGLQKMLLLIGPKRSGKGTIARVLRGLIGANNVAGPTTSSLAGQFGLQPLIAKTLAIVSDARFAGENVKVVIERLLCISGEDVLTIDRKHIPSVTMKLPTRMMFLTNEIPKVADSSGAMAGRFVVLKLEKSFFGQEDPELTEKLFLELPGILLWALEGWERLRQRARFIQPDSSSDTIQQLEDLASPVGTFVRERCVVGPGFRVDSDDLFGAWKTWCAEQGRDHAGTKGTFGRELRTVVPNLTDRQHGPGLGRRRFYEGIGLSHDQSHVTPHCRSSTDQPIECTPENQNTSQAAMGDHARLPVTTAHAEGGSIKNESDGEYGEI